MSGEVPAHHPGRGLPQMVRPQALFMVAMLLTAGCASQPASTSAPPPKVNLSGYPPAFREGYADGCASTGFARKRDESRVKTDAHYAQGWRDGYDICKSR